MRISAGKLAQLHDADPDQYLDELDALLGVSHDEHGYKTIKDPVIKPRSLSFLDVGEAFCGRGTLQTLYSRPFGARGGRANTRLAVGEEVGAGALGPSQFQQISAWLGTVAGLLGAELIQRYEMAVQIARQIVEWQLNVRTQDSKLIRYSRPSLPTENIQPNQEFPAGNLNAEYVRANRMVKQGEALSIAWEAAHFDITGDLMDAAKTVSEGIGYVVEERVIRGVFGIENTYRYLDTLTSTYRVAGSYVNMLVNNPLTNETDSLNNLEVLLQQQTDPGTGRPIAFAGSRNIIVSPFKGLAAQRLARMTQVEVGSLTDPSRFVTSPTITGINPYVTQFATLLMTQNWPQYGWTALSMSAAQDRYVYGDSVGAFRYRSAKDLTTYTWNIMDDPSLARRDCLMEMDISEMGSLTVKEPRRVILSTGPGG